MTTEKTYIVLNPRGIPTGIHILAFRPGEDKSQHQMWHEGDEFVKPAKMKAVDVAAWVKGGFLREK